MEDPARMLARALKERRLAMRLTQGQVAASIGVSRSSVTNYESGRHDLAAAKVVAYASAVGVRLIPVPTDLLGR